MDFLLHEKGIEFVNYPHILIVNKKNITCFFHLDADKAKWCHVALDERRNQIPTFLPGSSLFHNIVASNNAGLRRITKKKRIGPPYGVKNEISNCHSAPRSGKPKSTLEPKIQTTKKETRLIFAFGIRSMIHNYIFRTEL